MLVAPFTTERLVVSVDKLMGTELETLLIMAEMLDDDTI